MNLIEPPVAQSSPAPTAMTNQKVRSAISHLMIGVVSVVSVVGISLLVFAWKQAHNLHYFFSSLVRLFFSIYILPPHEYQYQGSRPVWMGAFPTAFISFQPR